MSLSCPFPQPIYQQVTAQTWEYKTIVVVAVGPQLSTIFSQVRKLYV